MSASAPSRRAVMRLLACVPTTVFALTAFYSQSQLTVTTQGDLCSEQTIILLRWPHGIVCGGWNWVLNAVSIVVKSLLDSASLSSSGFGLPGCFYLKGRNMKPLALMSKEIGIKKKNPRNIGLSLKQLFFHCFLKAVQIGSCLSSSWLRHNWKP